MIAIIGTGIIAAIAALFNKKWYEVLHWYRWV
jgi:hypothetical protein